MKKRLKQFLLCVMSGILFFNTPMAVFAENADVPERYELNITSTKGGSVSVEGQEIADSYHFEKDEKVTLQVNTNEGYALQMIDTEDVEDFLDESTESEISFLMPDHKVDLRFIFEKQDAGDSKTQEKEIAKRKKLAKEKGLEDWIDEDGYLIDDFYEGKSDLEINQMNISSLVNSIDLNGGISLLNVTKYQKVQYGNTIVGYFEVDGKAAMCCEHDRETPGVGSSTGTPEKITDNNLRRVMYYGYTGPGNIFSDYNKGCVATSLALSYYVRGIASTGMSGPHSGGAQSCGMSDLIYKAEQGAYVPDNYVVYRVTTNGGSTQRLMYGVTENKTFKNTINHWLTGFKNGEGNNGDSNTSYKMQVTTFASTDGSQALFNTDRKIAVPKGFYLDNSVYIASQKKSYNMPVSFTSNADIYASYFYRPYTYQISYDLGGGTNNSKNPSSYNVMYGELLYSPTKSGATFDGWTQENNLIGDSTYNYTFTNSNSQNSYTRGKIQICGIKSDKTWETSGPDISSSSTSGHVSTSYTHTKSTGLYSLRIAANGTKEDKSNYLYDVYFENNAEYKIEYDLQFSAQKVVMNNITVKRVSKVTGINYGKNATPLATSNYYSIAAQRQIGNIRLKANWKESAPSTPKTYTVRFNNNGGSGTMSDQTFNVGASQALKANTFTKSGYTFKGWNTQSNGSGNSYTDKQTVKDLTSAGGTITLYAQWTQNTPSTPKTYTVRFNNNGGSGTMSDQTFTVGVSQALKANTFTKSGYTFKGWNTQSNGSGTSYTNQQTVKDLTSAGKTITLYAQWTENAPSTPKTYTVRFNNNGGSGTMSDQTFTVGVSQALKANTFTKSGYTFRGWNTQSNGSGTSYTNRQTVKDLTSAGKTITLYAQWTENAPSTPKTYTVRFNNNGGSGTMSDQTFTVGVSQALKANTFTKSGYTFKGWNTQSNGSGTSYTNRQTVKDLTSAGNTITLYAQWTKDAPKTYTVRFNNNGGSGTMSDQTFTVDVSQALKKNTFTRTGYTFKGWNTQSNGYGNSYTDQQTVRNLTSAGGTITLYAQWKANEYTNTLYYNANGGTGAPASQTAKVTYPNTQKTFTVSSVKPTRAGYTFAGWYDAATGGNKIGSTVTVGSNSHVGNQSKTIYAHWTASEYTNTLSYNANGGTGAPASQTAKVTYPNTQSTFYVSSIKPTRTGYTFAGWYDAATGGNKVGSTVTVGSNSHAGNQSKTIYAHWTANEYTNTLYYNANGGSGAPASQTAKVTYPNTQSTFYVSSVKPTRTGYTFAGWYDASTGGNKIGATVTVGSNNYAGNQSKTIYAHWTANHYKLTVNPNKGSLPDGTTTDKTLSPDLIYDNGNWNNIYSQTPTRKGYTFTGWNTKADGSGVKVYDVNGACINGCGYWENNVYKGTTDLKVYAQWKANSYTITYNSNKPSNASNNVTGSTPNSTHTYDEPKNLTKNGYSLKGWTFTGWNTKADGSGKGYQDQQSVVNLAEKQGSIVVLYAQWRPNTYTIKYEGNGATSGSTPDSNMTYDKPGELNKNGFKKDNATFIGWKDENGNVYKDGETVKNLTPVDKGVVILKAQWDLAPTISAGEKTYYEGTTVTRDDLLKEVTATDPEDGTITNKIIITKIEYSAGKLVSGKKQPSYTQEWKDGMPKEATLDTWFMQLDKADSPVKHKVTYKVVDKVGNVTTKTVTVYVKYNNPPVITAVDRYFTLKEAQNGKVTADELLKNAIEKDKLKSTDIEEGVLSPKLELVGFNPADFTKLTTSAVVTVTYKVHDSYGPNGIGKETVNQIRVHITDPKQPIPGDSQMLQHVRFVTKKYYDLNKDKNIKDYLINDSELAKINSNGGLRVGCNWYSKDEYKSEITKTFDKTSGTTYKFSHEDVKKIQDYINTNGIGNTKKADSLSTFYQKFLNK